MSNIIKLKYSMIRTNKLFFVSILISCVSMAQELHHEMKGAQGGTELLANNYIVRYSVGQQSITGTYNSQVAVQHGFQQQIVKNKGIWNNDVVRIQALAFPNPFVDGVQINFSASPGPKISVTVFDLLGRVVYKQDFENQYNTVNLSLRELSSAEYIVTFTSQNFTDSINLLKL